MRGAGILYPIFSLSSPYGMGTLSKEAYEFIDFLKEAGQSYWQVLPVGPTMEKAACLCQKSGDSDYWRYSFLLRHGFL